MDVRTYKQKQKGRRQHTRRRRGNTPLHVSAESGLFLPTFIIEQGRLQRRQQTPHNWIANAKKKKKKSAKAPHFMYSDSLRHMFSSCSSIAVGILSVSLDGQELTNTRRTGHDTIRTAEHPHTIHAHIHRHQGSLIYKHKTTKRQQRQDCVKTKSKQELRYSFIQYVDWICNQRWNKTS